MNTRGRTVVAVVATLTLVAAATAVVLRFGLGGAEAQRTVSLNGVSPDRLSRAGLSLTVPEGSATVTEAQARSSILARFPGTIITDIALANFGDSHSSPAIQQLCWVASVAGYRRALPAPPSQPSKVLSGSMVVAIDALTGEFVESWQTQS